MPKFFVDVDGYGDLCIWDATEIPDAPKLVLHSKHTLPEHWDEIVARLTGPGLPEALATVQQTVNTLQARRGRALGNVNDRAQAYAQVYGATLALTALQKLS